MPTLKGSSTSYGDVTPQSGKALRQTRLSPLVFSASSRCRPQKAALSHICDQSLRQSRLCDAQQGKLFQETQWSVVLQARDKSKEALSALWCRGLFARSMESYLCFLPQSERAAAEIRSSRWPWVIRPSFSNSWVTWAMVDTNWPWFFHGPSQGTS